MTPAQFERFLKRLIRLGIPKVVLLLIILVHWLDLPPQADAYEVLELFAGVGRIAALSKYAGYKSAAVDLDYSKETWERRGKRSPMDINSDSGLVLCIHLVLTSQWEKLVCFLAIVCSSWVPVNRGSTARDIMTPCGNEDFPSVRKSNKMTSRCIILIAMVYCLGGTFVVENPANSLIGLHPRWIWFLERLRLFQVFVWKAAFWMRKYGHLSWKRTWLWSNSRVIGSCDLGPMTPHERRTAQPTTTRYRDKKGKLRFKGNVNLKKSQTYTYEYAAKLTQLVPEFQSDSQSHNFPDEEDPLNVLDMFAAMQFGDEDRAWDAEADLRRVVRYVRGSKRLVIPQTWRPVIPTEL